MDLRWAAFQVHAKMGCKWVQIHEDPSALLADGQPTSQAVSQNGQWSRGTTSFLFIKFLTEELRNISDRREKRKKNKISPLYHLCHPYRDFHIHLFHLSKNKINLFKHEGNRFFEQMNQFGQWINLMCPVRSWIPTTFSTAQHSLGPHVLLHPPAPSSSLCIPAIQ